MVVVYILGGIVVAVVGVLGWLFYSLKKNIQATGEAQVVPAANIEELRPSGDELKALREEVVTAREKMLTMARDFNETLGKMRAEKEGLRADLERLQRDNVRLNEEDLGHFKAENAAFKSQLAAGNAEIMELKRDNERLKALPVNPESFSGAPQINAQAVESLTEDLEVLRLDRARLEARVEELEEALRSDQEKGSFLQYELVKSRAHAVGMERVCENARLQFEGMAREAKDTQQDNALLKQQSGALEQSLADFKRLNSELLKREKLTQFELEHNRAQINDLEHIYEVFRSRLQSAGVEEGSLLTKS